MTSPLHRDHPDARAGPSRAATNDLLAVLATGGWRPGAWVSFCDQTTRRSWRQAQARPWALLQLTALHVGFAARARRGRRHWVGLSWLMACTHLGLLESRRSISLADVITLARGNLPALVAPGVVWLTPAAVLSDNLDGLLARRSGTTGPFGGYADSFADAGFWTWFTLRGEPDRRLRVAAALAWMAPVIVVTASSLAAGHMVPVPRPRRLRPAAAMQALLTARALHRHWQHRTRVGSP